MPLRKRIGLFCVRLALILITAGALLCLPVGDNGDFVRCKNAVVAFTTVVIIGVLLYDTFFYERFGQ